MEGRFSDFDIGSRLGGGSFGEVHAAYDRVQKARVALKRLRHPNALDLYRFKKEFRALADISHPNLVRLHELFEDNGQWYIAMELLDGVDIVSFVRRDDLLALAPTAPALAPVPPPEMARRPKTAEDLCLDRLRASFTQLAAGVEALHGAKRLHRDLKPSNVLVAADGTVKILDFGLVKELTNASGSLGQMVGTPAYMAPEQARGTEVTAAADWYAFGVLVYEALLGRLPFDGESLAIIAAKQTRDPIHPRVHEETLPADLCDLCMDLLHRDPARRPAGVEVLDLLSAATRPLRRISSPSPKTHLIGRDADLKVLRQAFDSSRGNAVVVHVAGPSGNGKTSLLRAFVESLGDGADTILLEGRCYESDGVPFKAVDTVMDATAARLLRLPATEVARILPRDFESLTRLFPVLKRLPSSPGQRPPARDLDKPVEVRRRGFAALRDMVGRIAERFHLVVCIDDLQWGDLDSVALLADLVRPPDAPPILLVLSYRSEQSEASAVIEALRESVSGERPVTIHVGPLNHDESVTLAHAILDGEGTVAEEDLDAIARESGGSPLFVKELARHVLDGAQSTEDVSIDDLIAQRLGRLARGPRTMLEVIAVAGKAIALATIRRVAGFSGEEALASLATLKSEHLVRARREGEHEVIESYHNRIRERVRALLAPERARRWHGLLAAALETTKDADAERIAIHYHASHTPERALHHAERAALAASAALAFDRATMLFRMVVDLSPAGGTEAVRARIQLAEALVHAGRGREGAVVFLDAADRVSGPEQMTLRRRASEQLPHYGHIDIEAPSNADVTVDRILPNDATNSMAPSSTTGGVRSTQLWPGRLRSLSALFVERKRLISVVGTVGAISVLALALIMVRCREPRADLLLSASSTNTEVSPPPIVFKVVPDQANLVVDDIALSPSVRSISRPAAGTSLSVTAHAEGYEDQTLTVDNAAPVSVDVWLNKSASPNYGKLSIICFPRCDSVFDNGEEIGPSPIIFKPVMVGEHTLRMSSSNPPATKVVSVVVLVNQTTTVRQPMSEPVSFDRGESPKKAQKPKVRAEAANPY